MDTQICHKNNTFTMFKTLLFVLLPLSIFSGLVIYQSKEIVFAQTEDNFSNTDVKGSLYTPDTTKERISFGPKLIYVVKENQLYSILTTLTDVNEILRKNNIEVERNDYVDINTPYVVDGSVIRIVRTDQIVVERFLDIPFKEEIVESREYFKGEKHIVQKGVVGIKKQRLLRTYEDGYLVKSEVLGESIQVEPVKQIVAMGTSDYLLLNIVKRGYNCPFWYSVVDSGPYTKKEKEWLKFVMYCESGCNAEADKGSYKGLFQWSPYWWKHQFNENIFDGYAQIKNTINKYRAGESTRASQWPACHAKYLREVSN